VAGLSRAVIRRGARGRAWWASSARGIEFFVDRKAVYVRADGTAPGR
jgi:hypothetical protein